MLSYHTTSIPVNILVYFLLVLSYAYDKFYVNLYFNFNILVYVNHIIRSSFYKILMAIQNSIVSIL